MREQNQETVARAAEARSVAYAKRKRTVKTVLIVFVVIAVISIAATALDPDRLTDRLFGKQEMQEEIYFYPVDENENIWNNEYYLGLDRRVFYSDASTGATYSLQEEELATAEPYARFFHAYFDSVIQGDAKGYAVYFSDAYLRENELPEQFTMQMIYDILVRPYESADDEQQRSAYLVDYKIYRNNGTFRDDIESNASRTLIFYLVTEQGELCIDEIVPYTAY